MTPRQRILRAFARQPVDQVPFCPNLTRWARGNRGTPSELQQLHVAEEMGFDPLILYGMYINHPIASDYVYSPAGYAGYRDLPGVTARLSVENKRDRTIHIRTFETPDGVLTDRIAWPRPNAGYGDGPNPHREEPLIKSLADVPALRHLYSQPHPGFTEDLCSFSELVGERGLVAFCDSCQPGAWGMESLGPDGMLISSRTDRQLLVEVLRISQDVHLRNLKTVLESGYKYFFMSWFQCGRSVGWSPDDIQDLFCPLIRESVELVHSYGGIYVFQDDGKMQSAIPFLADLGVDVAGSLQPPPVGDCDFGELKRHFGDRMCLLGGLDPIYTFDLGSVERVRNDVRNLCEQIGDGRGVVLATGEAISPSTPKKLLTEAVNVARHYTKTICCG